MELMVVSETNSNSINRNRSGLGAISVPQQAVHYHRTQKIVNKVKQAIRRTRANHQPKIPSKLDSDAESSDEEEDSRVKSIDAHSKRKKEVGTIVSQWLSGYRMFPVYIFFSFFRFNANKNREGVGEKNTNGDHKFLANASSLSRLIRKLTMNIFPTIV